MTVLDSQRGSATPEDAHAAILAGRTVRVVLSADPEDPTCLHYLDRCYENYHQPLIYTESIAGWSEGVKEAVCEPHSAFYVEWLAEDPAPLSITITDDEPPRREARGPVHPDDR